MYEHTYWNRNGEAQAKCDAMEAAGFQYTKATHALFHAYYRYHNDGDLPGWARSRWDLTKHAEHLGYIARELNAEGEGRAAGIFVKVFCLGAQGAPREITDFHHNTSLVFV
mgnify:CR=1 FL=1